MSDPENKRRIDSAQRALDAYQQLPGCDGDDLTDIGDLIVNLLHLAHARGMNDAQTFVDSQVNHFECEIEPDDIEQSFRDLEPNNAT